MYFVDVFEGLAKTFFAANSDSIENNDIGTTDNKPRTYTADLLGQVMKRCCEFFTNAIFPPTFS